MRPVRLTNADFLRYGVPYIQFYRILADAGMGFLLVLFGGLVALFNSRFGGFNSRLREFKFPFRLLRELARNVLIWPAIFGQEAIVNRENRKISRLNSR